MLQNNFSPKQQRAILLVGLGGILLIGIALRVLSLRVYKMPERDCYAYVQTIQLWTQNGGYPIITPHSLRLNDIPPLSLYLFKVASDLFPRCDVMSCGIAVSMIFGILFIILVWAMTAMMLHSLLLADMAALFLATNPFLVKYSTQMTREMPYLFFAASALFFLLCFVRDPKIIDPVWCAICSSCAYLCRHEAIEFFIFFIPLCLILKINRKIDWKRCFLSIAFFYVTTIAVLLFCGYWVGFPLEYYSGALDKIRLLERKIL